MEVQRISNNGGSHIEPPLDNKWTKSRQLEWKAAVVAIDTDLTVTVEHSFTPWVRYNVLVGQSVLGPLNFSEAWGVLTGVYLGAIEAGRTVIS